MRLKSGLVLLVVLIFSSFFFTGCDKIKELFGTKDNTSSSNIDSKLVALWWASTGNYGIEITSDGTIKNLTYNTSGNVIEDTSPWFNEKFTTAKDGSYSMHEWGTIYILGITMTRDTTINGGYSFSNNNSTLSIWSNTYYGTTTPTIFNKTSLNAHVITTLTLSQTSLSLASGGSGSVTITGGITPYYTYSSNSSVAYGSISGSTLTVYGVSAGSATITVYDNSSSNLYAYLYVTVTGTSTSLTLYPTSLSLSSGATSIVAISGGTTPYYTYSSNSSVAYGSISGSTLTVYGVSAGSATITVYDNSSTTRYAYLSVTVTGSSTSLTLYPTSLSLTNGQTGTATISGGTTPYYYYSSSNTSIATGSVSGSTLTVTASSSNTGSATITVRDNSSTTKYTYLTVTVTSSSTTTATISGYVRNASTYTGLSGATVTLATSPSRTTTTASDGSYSFTSVPTGTYTMTASMSGYIMQTTTVVLGSSGATANFALSQTSSSIAYRIVLTWGSTPYDLDGHLLKGLYEIYYGSLGSQTSAPYTTQDHDVTSGYGPETITIYQLAGDNCKYYVHNYSGSPAITTSGAQVNVYNGSSLIKTYNIPTSGTGLYWYVFDLSSAGTITDHNTITTSAPTLP